MPCASAQPWSVDYGMKLSSLMSAPKINNVPTMDALTERELDGLILQEPDGHLSHVLSLIFKTFSTTIPLANSLTVPLNTKTPLYLHNFRKKQNPTNKGETESVSLYDTVNHCWNWALPTHERHASKSPDKSRQDLREDEEDDEEDEEQDLEEEGNDGRDEAVGIDSDDSLADLPDVSAAPPLLGPISSSSISDEMSFAWFFNTVAIALTAANEKLTQFNPSGVIWTWSGANSMRPVKDNEIKPKPDLALLDDMEARWDMIKAVCELTSQKYHPTTTIAKTIDSKAYLLLRHQPWRHFILLLSDLDRFLHTFSCIIFGGLKCIGYDPTISIFTKTLQPGQLHQSSTFTHPTTGTAKYDLKQPNESAPVILESGALADDPISEPEGPEPSLLTKHPLPEDHEDHEDIEDIEDPENPLPEELLPEDLLLQEGLPTPLPADLLLAPLPELIGKIRVNHNYYNILEVMFSSQGLVSHGTVCYLTRRGKEEYIIKDHWVLGSKEDMLNEVTMLNEMKGVRGIPELVEHWLIEIASGEVDETEKYCYKTLESIEELVSVIWDIITIQKIAVKEQGILHRDCSLNNSMIKDDGNGSHGTLIDWEFAVRILQSNCYPISGMGTVLFMSRKLLHQLSDVIPLVSVQKKTRKKASHSRLQQATLIKHTFSDNLESLFYVFAWICIEFRGPLRMKWVLKSRGNRIKWLPCTWSANSYVECDQAKTGFFFHSEDLEKLEKQIHPYFKNLIPLTKEWYGLMRNNSNPDSVPFDAVLEMLNRHLTELPKDEPSPELLFAKTILKQKQPTGDAPDSAGAVDPGVTRLPNDMTGHMGPAVGNMTMEAAVPIRPSKWNKT
ncbi:uncharacterized protein BJ212DRAFT_1479245 [Suillus subaureus]|uniref:Fungal-type protein kinase domain-containing protein n=1 Tax=Suillus subaureus TaxID=48587 RepID=A0A9P7EEW4_9AGAM|nr:uncharacterized protein BJ212DRAFT_1479245 [Suillus subaureus]KAG1819135.1 hypothetical protein BJ212DRAFT_1479245 [Suillus subaureus]